MKNTHVECFTSVLNILTTTVNTSLLSYRKQSRFLVQQLSINDKHLIKEISKSKLWCPKYIYIL